MRTHSTRGTATWRVAALCLAGTTALALTSCTAGGGGSTDAPSAGAAQQQTPHAQPQTDRVTQANFADTIAASQKTITSMHMDVTYSGAMFEDTGMSGAPVSIDINLAGATPLMHTTGSMLGSELDMILVDGEMYLGMGASGDGKYLHMSAADLAADQEFSGMADSFKANTDLGAQAKGFAAGITSFKETGTDVVDGKDVTLYTMTADPSKITGDAAGIDPTMLAQVGDLTVVYALDKDNVPLKVDVTMDITGKTMNVTSVASKINEPVTITAPPADQVVEYADMMAAG